MKSLEYKGGIIDIVARVNDVEELKKLYELVRNFVKKHEIEVGDDEWSGIPDNIRKEIEASFENIENKDELITHEEMIKQIKKWEDQ